MADVEIIRDGRRIMIDPCPLDVKEELVFNITNQSYYYNKRKKGMDLFTDSTREHFFTDHPDKPDAVFALAGFYPRVKRTLKHIGYTHTFTDVRNLNLEDPDFSVLEKGIFDPPYDWQADCLTRLLSAPEGRCKVWTGGGKSFLIAKMATLFPNTTQIVTCDKSQILRDIYKMIKAETDEVAGLGTVNNESEPSRITVCHHKSLLKAPVDKAKIVYVDECHTAAADQISQDLCNVAFANMYGFSASPEDRQDGKECRTEGLMGPILYELNYNEAKDKGLISEVEVTVYPYDGGEIPSYLTKTFHKRLKFGYVRNKQRNRYIADVVKGDFANDKVMILCVDDLEHVFRLLQHLPDDFTPVYDPASFNKKKNKKSFRDIVSPDYEPLAYGEQYNIADKFREGEIDKVVTTSIWETGVDLPELGVLVRADGGQSDISSIQAPGRVTRLKKGDNKGKVVDFTDNFGSTFNRRANKRISSYHKFGYTIKYAN